jgi:hypothetical protein
VARLVPQITLRHRRAFRTCILGNLAKRSGSRNPPSVVPSRGSRSIGARLFRRSARAISLTDEGHHFYEAIAPHLAAIVDASTEAGGSSSKVRGRLRVNVDAGIG